MQSRYLLSFLTLTVFSAIVSASEAPHHSLFKRQDKLPFDTLPIANCPAPSICSSIQSPITCRCNDLVTVCHSTTGQFCWGSSLLGSSTCPTIPTSCASQLQGTPNCLCNGSHVLCVDGFDHYCYGDYQTSAATPIVTLLPLPTLPVNTASASSTAPASASASTSASSTATTSVSIGFNPAPSVAPSPTPTSDAQKLFLHQAWVPVLAASLYFMLQ
ncbi:hypothetical protein BDF14DRAFT_1769729 [Spinellus fusiger]|nr:hypothetical protein BDF14DRAFT_1769729 [Spinellus fusiger]